MSYCRQGGDSDVYVVHTTGGWECFCRCPGVIVDSRPKMLRHLLTHRKRGDKVPAYATDRLKQEIRAKRNRKRLQPSKATPRQPATPRRSKRG